MQKSGFIAEVYRPRSHCDAKIPPRGNHWLNAWKRKPNENPRCHRHEVKYISLCYKQTKLKIEGSGSLRKPIVIASTKIFASFLRIKFEIFVDQIALNYALFLFFCSKISFATLNVSIWRFRARSLSNMNGSMQNCPYVPKAFWTRFDNQICHSVLRTLRRLLRAKA